MALTDVIGLGVFWLFGAVCVVFPAQVLRFYHWFHSQSAHVQRMEPRHIRNAGILWLVIMAVVTYVTRHQTGLAG